MKIAHEAPMSIMDDVRTKTDYCYALVHLFPERTDYFNFFRHSLHRGRKVILDNSLFELGDAFDAVQYVQWINELEPTEFIIPDALGDTEKTLKLSTDFLDNCAGAVESVSVPIGVVQGSTYEEMCHCYKEMDTTLGCKKIAFAFISKAFTSAFPHPNNYVSMSMGRVLVLSRMLRERVINTTKPHHLLGCMHPREFSFYTGPEFHWIDTIDTSSPVVHGIKGILYSEVMGTWEKESTKVVDLLDAVLDANQIWHIMSNIKKFREYTTP